MTLLESTSQFLQMSLGTPLLPCHSCILNEIPSLVEIQPADGYFSNYMFMNYQGGFETSSLFWFDCCVCRHRFSCTCGFPLCNMSEIPSNMYAGHRPAIQALERDSLPSASSHARECCAPSVYPAQTCSDGMPTHQKSPMLDVWQVASASGAGQLHMTL